MRFTDKQKKIVCLVVALAMVVPIVIGIFAIFAGANV